MGSIISEGCTAVKTPTDLLDEISVFYLLRQDVMSYRLLSKVLDSSDPSRDRIMISAFFGSFVSLPRPGFIRFASSKTSFLAKRLACQENILTAS
ncbi:hypothetical protein AVEN_211131-1 [Araneus ventricosus]|uniref:Uncharacterized protein n=1 Tax=Araneus ventricosus TaxID=182803 RepID=A0A4Y2USP9_ARAVE|nr:hypothetical protein AVEN_211131-1 [Araneus ventricosus]